MSNVTPLNAFPSNRASADLHLLAGALSGIRRHLQSGGSDNDFMLRLAATALRTGSATISSGSASTDLVRHSRGLHALYRHLTVGGTDRAILVGLTTNALTGYSPATPAEADLLPAVLKAAA